MSRPRFEPALVNVVDRNVVTLRLSQSPRPSSWSSSYWCKNVSLQPETYTSPDFFRLIVTLSNMSTP